jgi:hypothetical protein
LLDFFSLDSEGPESLEELLDSLLAESLLDDSLEESELELEESAESDFPAPALSDDDDFFPA